MTPKKRYKSQRKKIPLLGCKRLFTKGRKRPPRFGVFANEQGFYRHNGEVRHL